MWINKYLAQQGFSTRRGADELVKQGKVFINGKRAKATDKVLEGDKVEVKGFKAPTYKYYAYFKPRGVITHSAQGEEQEIKEIFPIPGVFPVGRLDKDSHGLIILTTDGRITDRLLNPKYDHDKEYIVKVDKLLKPNVKTRFEKGVLIEGYKTAPTKVKLLSEKTFQIILREGKKHQIRRMCAALGYTVIDLKRTRVMNIRLNDLKSGEYRELTGEELNKFLISLGL